MKYKVTEIEHEKITQTLKDFARKSIKDLWNNKQGLKSRVINVLTGLSIYAFFAITWVIRNYRWVKEFLRVKFGISIRWVIIILFSAWVIGGSLQNASHY